MVNKEFSGFLLTIGFIAVIFALAFGLRMMVGNAIATVITILVVIVITYFIERK